MKQSRWQAQRGFSIAELAIVLGVVGIVMGGVWVLVNNIQRTARLELTKEQVIAIAKNVRAFYQARACIQNGNRNAELIAANPPAYPREMIADAVTATDQWGGAVEVQGTNAGCDLLFTIRFTALTPDVCMQLVPKLTGSGEAARGLQNASLNGFPLAALPPSPVAISGVGNGQCQQAAIAQFDLNYRLRVAD